MRNNKKILIFFLVVIVGGSFLYYNARFTYTAYESIIEGATTNSIAGISLKINGVDAVANNDGTNRLGVDATYDLKIVTTTNLPLEYKLFRNQTYDAAGAVNIISSSTTVAADEDGTYFKTMVAPSENFSYTADQQYSYQLVIYFPTTYMSYNYKDIVESIEIVVDSRQILDSDN